MIRDNFNRPERSIFYGPTKTLQREVVYENEKTNRITSERLSLGANFTDISYTRDQLKRISEIKTVKDGNGYERKFVYTPRGHYMVPEGVTNYVDSISYYNVVNDVSTLEKTESIAYNADGNIITYGDNTYVYDNLGRLLRENNKNLDKTTVFVYNVGGNIVSKTEYAYTTGTVGAATATYMYAYGNAWKNQLTSYGGNAITYDASGNPTSYLGKTLTWGRGRLLTKYANGTTTVDMQYDANGFRTSKTKTTKYSTTTYSYIYSDNGRLLYDRINTFDRYYFYGVNGIEGFEEDGVRYIYRKNLFGDITAIYQGTNKVAEYVYDAWGNCTITHDSNGFASRNPFRYRGYYWDDDLKMYYLMTRYYDPQIGRFINADNLNYLEPHTINGLNLYAYCLNNPIMCVDSSGTNGAEVKAFDGEYDPDDDVFNGGGGIGGGTAPRGTATSQSGGTRNQATENSQKFTPDQQALLGLAKEYMQGVSLSEGYILVGWANEYGISNHGPMVHLGRSGYWSNTEHIKIKNMHIPIIHY